MLFALVFAVDAQLPPGYAGAMAYVLPVLLGLWVRARAWPVVIAGLATVAMVVTRVGAELPDGVASWLMWLNRATALVAVWATALVVAGYRRARAQADDERAKIGAILETASDAIVSAGDDGSIELFNSAAERMFGWTAREALGQPVHMLWASPAGRLLLAGEHQGVRKDGTIFPLEVAVAEVALQGRRIFTAIMRDVSQRKELERTRDATLRSLVAKNEELERFTYTVSHDLKSPLVTIRGFLGLLERAAVAGDLVKVKADVERIDAAADKMRQLLDELLELSRIGRVAGPIVEVPLSRLAAEVLETLAGPVAAAKATVEIVPDLPAVRGDRLRLRQLLQNLLENALKFSAGQATPRIRIGAERKGAEVVAWVQDNGAGIDPRYHEKVFGLFEKLDRKTPGTGVGLALVRRIAEVHEGRAWVESEGPGRGSRFCFALPAAPASGDE
ncbi:MAG: PAS domain S-box protein [Archangiaceae bacterium]|nr:PAS domain S-box protein [Archangiaceae bacterium]